MVKVLRLMIAVMLATMTSMDGLAQSWPARPVKIVVPYAAGSGTDVATRVIATELGKALAQQFVVENRPGMGGNLGVVSVVRTAPDGYTLIIGTAATHAVNPYLYPSLGFDPEADFDPVSLTLMLPMVISANVSIQANSIPELIALAKRNPGTLNIAYPGNAARLAFEVLKQATSAPIVGVPYKSSATAVTEVIGGQVQLLVDSVSATRPHAAAGRIRALGVTSLRATEAMPGVKSIAEQGYPGLEVTTWNAVFAPKGTPRPVIDLLNARLKEILATPDVRARMFQLGFEPAGDMSPAQIAKFVAAELERWGAVVKASGMRAD